MQRILVLLGLFIFLGFHTQLFAQTASLDMISEDLIVVNDDNWSFYSDDENKLFYIDFEKINFNLSNIIVKNDIGDVLFKDDVLDLPIDTIYELDFNDFNSGMYSIELRSFTGVIKKEISIN